MTDYSLSLAPRIDLFEVYVYMEIVCLDNYNIVVKMRIVQLKKSRVFSSEYYQRTHVINTIVSKNTLINN